MRDFEMKQTIIIFPLLTWGSDLLHRDQALAKEFAKKGNPVYFIDRITRMPWKMFSNARHTHDSGVNVVRVYTFPYFRGRFVIVYRINNWLIRKQLRNVYDQIIGLRYLYISNPDWAEHVLSIRKDKDRLVYDISDDYMSLTKNKTWADIVAEEDLLMKANTDICISTRQELLKGIDGKIPTAVVTNGVDQDEFTTAKPIIQRGGYKKVAGFIGGIYEWVDLELVQKSAMTYPETLFVLIGPTNRQSDIEKICNTENIRYLGVKSKQDIGDYFASLDVGLVPFVSVESYPRLATVDSGKIYQYLFFGYPVVSTSFPQAESLRKYVFIAPSTASFLSFLGAALQGEGNSDERKNFARKNTWNKKANDILEFIGKYS